MPHYGKSPSGRVEQWDVGGVSVMHSLALEQGLRRLNWQFDFFFVVWSVKAQHVSAPHTQRLCFGLVRRGEACTSEDSKFAAFGLPQEGNTLISSSQTWSPAPSPLTPQFWVRCAPIRRLCRRVSPWYKHPGHWSARAGASRAATGVHTAPAVC